MRVGVLGGTFDPPHTAHLIVAQDAAEVLRLDRVLFVPAALPPHKRAATLTPASLRLEMLRAALDADPRFEICELELRRPGPSYTVDTLRALRRERPGDELVLLIGLDQWMDFRTWHEPESIVELADVAVLARPGSTMPDWANAVPHRLVDVTQIDISSTTVRRRVQTGRSIRYLVSDAVAAIIAREALYVGS